MPNNPHDSWADIYDEAYIQSFGSIYSELTKTSLNIIQKNTKPGAEILDIGAGTGRLSIPLMKLGYSLSAVDASKNMLEVLKRKDTEQAIDTIHCSIQNLDLNRNFEAVLCIFSVFCYLLDEKDLRAAIQSIVNHTHREGFVLIDVPSKTLFTSSYYESEALIREIEVKSVDSDGIVVVGANKNVAGINHIYMGKKRKSNILDNLIKAPHKIYKVCAPVKR